MSPPKEAYTSFIVRLWQDGRSEEPGTGGYHAEVEHIQTGEKRQFMDPDEFWSYLNASLFTSAGSSSSAEERS